MFLQGILSITLLLNGAAAFVPVAPSKSAVSARPTFLARTHTNEFQQTKDGLFFGRLGGNGFQLYAAASDEASGPVKLIIAGAPASGKGTQCEVIKEKFGVVHLSTGDMLRAAVAAETEVGKQAKGFMDSGKLVPDEVIIGIVSLALT